MSEEKEEKKDEKKKETPDSQEKSFPKLHTIAYPEKYKPFLKEEGASAFGGRTNHPASREITITGSRIFT